MDHLQLLNLAKAALDNPQMSMNSVVLKVPRLKRRMPTGRVRLAGRGSPLGHVVGGDHGVYLYVVYSAHDIIMWLNKTSLEESKKEDETVRIANNFLRAEKRHDNLK